MSGEMASCPNAGTGFQAVQGESVAQRVMREDMEAASTALGTDDAPKYMSGGPKRPKPKASQEPISAGDALDEVIGTLTVGWETAIFIQLVPDHQQMTLSLQQWNIVQAMVEDGIRRGYRRGTADAG